MKREPDVSQPRTTPEQHPAVIRTRSDLRRRRQRTARIRNAILALAGASALVIALLPAVAGLQSAQAASFVLQATDAGWTTNRQPAKTQKSNYLSVTAVQDRTYLKFPGATLKGQKVVSATLELRVRSTTATRPGVVAHSTSTAWNSSTLTFANQPKSTRVISKPSVAPRAGRTLSIPIDVKAISTTGDFAIRLSFVQKYIRLQIEKGGAYAPKLVLKTTPAAAKPSPTASATPKPTASATPKPTASATPKPTATATPKPTATATPSPSATPKPTASPRPTPSPTATAAPPAQARPAGAPLVFAHYFVPYPLSLDNQAVSNDYYARHYLRPDGEGGKFASVGGLLRDRPLSPGASSSSTWRLDNLVTETRQAKAAGVDGWALNLMSTSGQNWDASLNLMKAAEKVGGFVVVPMVDASSNFVNNSPDVAASLLSKLYASPAAYKEDGEYLLSSFKAEGAPVSWWTEVIRLLETKYKLPITFQAVFLDAGDSNMKAFAGIADGYGNWGSRTERTTQNNPNYDARAAAHGKTWMQPVAVQDVRYRDARWAESHNTATLRAQWERAIREDVDYVQIVTWNDYSESTQIAPSYAHDTAFLDMTRYYTSWFHHGTPPKITSDEIVITHRTHLTSAKPSYSHKLMGAPALDGTSTPARDSVEAVVWLTAPATVEITVGGKTTSFSAPAGVSAHTVPLALGKVSAKVVRSGSTVENLASPHEVVKTPYVQDLQYFAVSSW